MRIRKNAKFSNLMMFSHASTSAYPSETLLQTHVCQLNQSPWDVITFSPVTDSNTSSCPPEHQLEGEYSFTGNASIGDSIGAVESVASMKISIEGEGNVTDMVMKREKKKEVNNSEKRENGIGLRKEDSNNNNFFTCNKTDGKGWQCRREAKEGHSLCEHHLAQLRSYSSLNHSNSRKSDKLQPPLPPPPPSKVPLTVGIRRRGRAGKKASTSNPNEFYYYSGFGPLWGRKRSSGKGTTEANTKSVEEAINETTPSSSSQIDNSNDNEEQEEFDLVDHDDDDYDYDDDDDDGDGDNGDENRKRARKPVKARSLKSLM